MNFRARCGVFYSRTGNEERRDDTFGSRADGPGAHGRCRIAWTIGARGVVAGVDGRPAVLRHNYRDGLTPDELFALVASARQAMNELLTEWERLGSGMHEQTRPRGYGTLARAMRSPLPGVVFALAAAAGEVDPLVDLGSRLFVGLPPVA
jgi:hypothetical protein